MYYLIQVVVELSSSDGETDYMDAMLDDQDESLLFPVSFTLLNWHFAAIDFTYCVVLCLQEEADEGVVTFGKKRVAHAAAAKDNAVSN